MEIYNSNNQNDNSPKKQCPFCASMMNVNCNYCPGCGSPMNIHEIQENSSRESNSTNPNDNIVLSLVFGALGGLLGLVFGFYGLFNKRSGKNTKILCWIGITLFFLWIVALVVLYIIYFNMGAKPYIALFNLF